MTEGMFAVEPPRRQRPTSRGWYVLGGALMAPWLLREAVDPLLELGLVQLGGSWVIWLLVWLGFIVGGVIVAITAEKRFKQQRGG